MALNPDDFMFDEQAPASPTDKPVDEWLNEELSSTAPASMSEFASQRLAGQASIVDGVPNFQEEATRKLFSDNMVDEINKSSAAFYDRKKQELTAEIDQRIGTPDFDVNSFIPEIQKRSELISSTSTSPMAHEVALVTSAAPDAQPDRAREAVVQAAAINYAIEMGEKAGFAAHVSDFVGSALASVQLYEVTNIDDYIKQDPVLSEIHGANLEETIFNWQALPPAKKEALLPALQATFKRVAPDAISKIAGVFRSISPLPHIGGAVAGATGISAPEEWNEDRMTALAVEWLTTFITTPDAYAAYQQGIALNTMFTALDVAPFAKAGATSKLGRGVASRVRGVLAKPEEVAAGTVLRSEGEAAAAAGAAPAPAPAGRTFELGEAPKPIKKTTVENNVLFEGREYTPEEIAAKETELWNTAEQKLPVATQKRLEAERGRWEAEKRQLQDATAKAEHEPIKSKTRKDAVRVANKERNERIAELDARIRGIEDQLAYSRKGYQAEAELSRLKQAKDAQPPRTVETTLAPSRVSDAVRASIENARSAKELAAALKLSPTERLAVNAVLKEVAEDAAARGSVVHIAAAAGDTKAAATHAAAAASNPDVAKSLGTTQMDAALAADPAYIPGEWMKEVVPELSGDMARIINESAAHATGYTFDMMQGPTGLRVGVLSNPVERKLAAESVLEKMRTRLEKDAMQDNMVVDNLRIVSSDQGGFVYEYTLRRNDGVQTAVKTAQHYDTVNPTKGEMERVLTHLERGNGSLRQTMLSVMDDPKAPAKYRVLAKKLARALERMEAIGIQPAIKVAGPGVLKNGTRGLTRTRAEADILATGKPGTVEVILNGSADTNLTGVGFQTLMHEAVHSTTMVSIHYGNMYAAAGSIARKNVQDLYSVTNAAIKAFNNKLNSTKTGASSFVDDAGLTPFERQTFYGENNAFNDPNEVLAWGMTNPDMQSWLRMQPSVLGPGSMWDSFVYSVGKLLGIGKKELTLLDDVMSVGSRLIDVDPMEVRGIANKIGQSFMESEQRSAVVQTGRVTFTLDDVTGTYEATVESLAKRGDFETKYKSPTTWSVGGSTSDFGRAVIEEMIEVDAGAAYEKAAKDMHKWAMAPISGRKNAAARKRVEDVLDALDEYINPDTHVVGKVATPTELAAGIQTKSGLVRLTTPEEVTAYYRLRQLADAEWELMNYAQRRKYELGGFKEVVLHDGTKQIAKPYESEMGAKLALANKEGHAVFNPDTKTTEVWTPEILTERYKAGYKLARLRKQYNTSGGRFDLQGERVEYLWVKQERVRELPSHVLHYKPGYVPRINKAEYMLSKVDKVHMRGNPAAEETSAMRGFNSLDDAKLFRTELVARDLNLSSYGVKIDGKGGYVFPENMLDSVKQRLSASIAERENGYRIGGSANYSLQELLEDAVESSGGLYTGERARERLLFGLSGKEMERVPALEAYARQSSNVGRLVSRNEMRLAREKKWLNTVRKFYPDVRLEGFDNTRLPPDARGKALEVLRQQIREWNGVPSHAENMLQAGVQAFHDWTLNEARRFDIGQLGFADKYSASLMSLKHSNPINALKAANMHILLGFLNPKQWLVQGANAVTAMARHYDVHVTGSNLGDVHLAFKWGLLDNIRNDAALGRSVSMLRKEWGLTPEMEEAYMAWRRSGLRDSVMQNADLANISTSGLGVTREVLEKAENISMAIYNSGELFNRRFSFIKGYAAQMKKVKAEKRVWSDDDLFDAVADAQRSMWEMNRANRAAWQGGAGTSLVRQMLGMYTQFYAVGIKPIEMAVRSTAHGGFTRQELRRVMFGQLMFFGFAGLPLGGYILNAIKETAGVEELPPAVVEALNQGVAGTITNTLLGGELDISRNLSVGGQLTDMVREMMRSGDPMIYAWLGVTGSTGVRVLDAFKEMKHLWLAGGEIPTGEKLLASAPIIASVVSSFSNGTKGWLMHKYHKLYRRDLVTAVAADDFSVMEEIFTGMGFRPLIENTVYTMGESVRNKQELIKELGDARIRLKQRMLFSGASPEALQALQDADTFIGSMVQDDPIMLHDLIRYMDSRIYDNPQSLEEKAIKTWVEDNLNKAVTDTTVLDIGSPAGLVQPLKGEGEE